MRDSHHAFKPFTKALGIGLSLLSNAIAAKRFASTAMMVEKSVKNWPQVLLFLLSAGNKNNKTISVHFDDSLQISGLADAAYLDNLIRYYYLSHKIGAYSRGDILTLHQLHSVISNQLAIKFSQSEVERGAIGGGFSRQVMMLFLLVRKFKPKLIVETGVGPGASSYLMLKALELNGGGRLISVDYPNRNPAGYRYADGTLDAVYTPSELAPGWLVPTVLRRSWTLRLGRSQDVLPMIKDEIDMFFHDSEHSYENMTFELEWAYSHLRDGGVLCCDDTPRNDAFSSFLGKHENLRQIISDSYFGNLVKLGGQKLVKGEADSSE